MTAAWLDWLSVKNKPAKVYRLIESHLRVQTYRRVGRESFNLQSFENHINFLIIAGMTYMGDAQLG